MSKWLYFAHKIAKNENFCPTFKISLWIFRKVKTNVISPFSYNIMTWNHVFECTTCYILENLLLQKSTRATFHMYSHTQHRYVDQNVSTCWPKFRIWKYTLSAFCSYFYSSQNPSGGSEIISTVKKVRKITKPMNLPYWP